MWVENRGGDLVNMEFVVKVCVVEAHKSVDVVAYQNNGHHELLCSYPADGSGSEEARRQAQRDLLELKTQMGNARQLIQKRAHHA